jgi:hypothetical protein
MAAIELYSTLLFSDANLVAYYRAENANDSKASFNLTNTGSVAFSAAKFNNGFDYGSTNSHAKSMNYPTSSLGVDLSGASSFMFWVKVQTAPPNGGNADVFYDWRSTVGTARYFQFQYIQESAQLKLRFDPSGGTNIDYNVDLGTSAFHLIAVTCSAAGAVKVYLDGSEVATGTRGTTTAAANNMYIGNNIVNSRGAAAYIDDVSLWSDVLTATEISDYYNGNYAGTTSLFFSQL